MLNIDAEKYHGVGVYKILNNKNNKVYIGSAIDCARRVKQHKKSFKSLSCNSKILKDVIGGYEFRFEIIWIPDCKITWFDLYEKEAEYINKYNSLSDGYNIAKTTATSKSELLRQLKQYRCQKGKMAEQGAEYILEIIRKRNAIIN